ncbi:immunity 22 family protein [Myroides sp. C6-3]|uniref:immunity 22 family protein n=1 Tax=Myroides sp. C6-3 TaxID=3400535 RepID=UPI003D2F736D
MWLANFTTEEKLEEYLEFRYSELEDLPRSNFIDDFEIEYYDEDFQEAYCANNISSVKELLDPISYSESFIYKVGDTSDSQCNSVVAIYNYKYVNQKQGTDNIQFLGVFDYDS